MRRLISCGLVVLAAGFLQSARAQGQKPATDPDTPVGRSGANFLPPAYDLEDGYLKWRLLPSEQKYASIDGKHLNEYVKEFTNFSFRYRDAGHQWWGRIMGTSGDAENAQWLAGKFKELGLQVTTGDINLPPQWHANTFGLDATCDGKTLHLESAWPALYSPATPAEGLDLEAVYAGFGTEADYHHTDVKGKAVVIFSVPLPAQIHSSAAMEGAVDRAAAKGAAAVIEVVMLPGNVETQLHQAHPSVPVLMTVGMLEGYKLRDWIGRSSADQPVHLKIRLDSGMVPNLKTSVVFGTLPGATDEKIFILAHRDGWFAAAEDNASGIATELGLAEYFSKIPQAQRRRTIVFVGTPGHHDLNGHPWGGEYMLQHKEMLDKTAFVMNSEHTAAIGYHVLGEAILRTNESDASSWSINGSPRLHDIIIKSLRDFGVPTYAQPYTNAPGEISPLYDRSAAFQLMNFEGPYFHSQGDDSVPSNGLEDATRAYAHIIDEVNKVDLKDLQPATGQTAGAEK